MCMYVCVYALYVCCMYVCMGSNTQKPDLMESPAKLAVKFCRVQNFNFVDDVKAEEKEIKSVSDI